MENIFALILCVPVVYAKKNKPCIKRKYLLCDPIKIIKFRKYSLCNEKKENLWNPSFISNQT